MSFSSEQAKRVVGIATKIYEAICDQDVPDVGIAMTQAMALFLAHIELESLGDGQDAYDLLVRGIKQLFDATMGDIAEMRKQGLNNDQIRLALKRLIPETVDYTDDKDEKITH